MNAFLQLDTLKSHICIQQLTNLFVFVLEGNHCNLHFFNENQKIWEWCIYSGIFYISWSARWKTAWKRFYEETNCIYYRRLIVDRTEGPNCSVILCIRSEWMLLNIIILWWIRIPINNPFNLYSLIIKSLSIDAINLF